MQCVVAADLIAMWFTLAPVAVTIVNWYTLWQASVSTIATVTISLNQPFHGRGPQPCNVPVISTAVPCTVAMNPPC